MPPANSPYKKEEDQKYSPSTDNGNQSSRGKVSYGNGNPWQNRNNLNDLEEQADDGEGFYNPQGDSTGGSPDSRGAKSDTRSAKPSRLKDSENLGNVSPDKDSIPYNEDGDKPRSRMQRAGAGVTSYRRGARRLSGRLLGNKWMLGVGVGASGALAVLFIIFVLIIGAYKAVDFAEHVAAYQFARTTSLAAEATDNIAEEATSVGAVSSDSLIGRITSSLNTAKGNTSELLSKFDKFRPNKIFSNLQSEGGYNGQTMEFNYGETATGKQYIRSVTLNGVEYDLGEQSLKNSLKNLIPGYKFVRQVQITRNFIPNEVQLLKDADIGVITRGKFASLIRQKLGVGLAAWLVGRALGPNGESSSPSNSPPKTQAQEADEGTLPGSGDDNQFAGYSQKQADAQIDRNALAASDGMSLSSVADAGDLSASQFPSPADQGEPNNVQSAATAAEQDMEKGLGDDNQTLTMAQQADEGLLPGANAESDVAAVITEASLSGLIGIIESLVKLINPIYAVATPLCLIYDGSIQHSKASIDSQTDQIARTGVFVQAASAQLKDGYTAGGEVDGALDYKLGNVLNSYAEEEATGIRANTSNYQSTEESPTGQYTYTIADYLGPSLGGFIDSLGTACPVLTNLWVAGGVAATNVALAAPEITGAISDTTGALADSGMKEVVQIIGGKIRNGASSVSKFVGKTTGTLFAVGGATLIAHELVSEEVGANHSGLATGQTYDNDAYCGTNVYANQLDQQEFYGAPLQDSELGQDNANNQAQLADSNQGLSAYQRYLSASNPNSLVSNVALAGSGYLSSSILSSTTSLGASLLNPTRSLSSLISPLLTRRASAATPVTSVNTYCGNVQFGYTAAEKQLINSCPADTHDPDLCSYEPLENQQILDNYGNESAIAAKYGTCFTSDIGDLLQSGDIQRSKDGNVLAGSNDGLCSPDNLSFDNTSDTSLSGDGSPNSPNPDDMIFRYRLANFYNNTMDQLLNEQSVGGSDGAYD